MRYDVQQNAEDYLEDVGEPIMKVLKEKSSKCEVINNIKIRKRTYNIMRRQ